MGEGSNMCNVTIDGIALEVCDGATVLEAAKQAGIDIPTLCFMPKINEIGSCRVCVVEIEGEDGLAAACNTPVCEGMCIRTATPRVVAARPASMVSTFARRMHVVQAQRNVCAAAPRRRFGCERGRVCPRVPLGGVG